MYRPEWYNHSDLHTAWGLLISAAEATTGGGCVVAAPSVYDIVDVGREFLSVATCPGRYDALVKAATPGAIKVGHVTSLHHRDRTGQNTVYCGQHCPLPRPHTYL
jgi:hypothetical protein